MAPANLAVFRIVVFALVLQKTNLDYAVWLAGIPPVLVDPPWGMNWIVSVAPFDPQTVRYMGWLLMLTCGLGIAGFCSRTCAAVTAILGLYVLGIPQCIGKVGHYNHLIWFLTILAVSPCGAAISVDALIRSWKRRSSGMLGPNAAGISYGFPLRIAQVLFGIIYFFPGFWKLWTSGIDWISADNLSNLVARYQAMQELTRAQWVLEAPLLLQAGGVAVLLFELGFVFALFKPRARVLMVAAGVAFHLANWYVLNIVFHPLLACYVVFVDWGTLARRIRLRFGAVTTQTEPAPFTSESGSRLGTTQIAGSVFVVVAAIYAGAMGITQGWPFACYPTFAEDMKPQIRVVVLDQVTGSETASIELTESRRRMGGIRWESWIDGIVSTEGDEVREARLTAFARWCAREYGVQGEDVIMQLTAEVLDVSTTPWRTISRDVMLRCGLANQ
jgi:hypothetical protein